MSAKEKVQDRLSDLELFFLALAKPVVFKRVAMLYYIFKRSAEGGGFVNLYISDLHFGHTNVIKFDKTCHHRGQKQTEDRGYQFKSRKT